MKCALPRVNTEHVHHDPVFFSVQAPHKSQIVPAILCSCPVDPELPSFSAIEVGHSPKVCLGRQSLRSRTAYPSGQYQLSLYLPFPTFQIQSYPNFPTFQVPSYPYFPTFQVPSYPNLQFQSNLETGQTHQVESGKCAMFFADMDAVRQSRVWKWLFVQMTWLQRLVQTSSLPSNLKRFHYVTGPRLLR